MDLSEDRLSRSNRQLRSDQTISDTEMNEELKSESSNSSGIDNLRRRFIREHAVRLGNIDRAELLSKYTILYHFNAVLL